MTESGCLTMTASSSDYTTKARVEQAVVEQSLLLSFCSVCWCASAVAGAFSCLMRIEVTLTGRHLVRVPSGVETAVKGAVLLLARGVWKWRLQNELCHCSFSPDKSGSGTSEESFAAAPSCARSLEATVLNRLVSSRVMTLEWQSKGQ